MNTPGDGRQVRTLAAAGEAAAASKKKLSYVEAREFATIEKRLEAAEKELHVSRAALEDPTVTSDHVALQAACVRIEEAQKTVETL